MAYKKIQHNFTFADIAIQNFADKNRTLLFLRQVEKTINWKPIQDLLMKYYKPGRAKRRC